MRYTALVVYIIMRHVCFHPINRRPNLLPSYPAPSLRTTAKMTGIDFTVFKGSSDGKIVQSKTHKESIKPDEVLLKVTHAGLCGTDQHYKTAGIVLGHEGVGLVQQVGSQVTMFKVYAHFLFAML